MKPHSLQNNIMRQVKSVKNSTRNMASYAISKSRNFSRRLQPGRINAPSSSVTKTELHKPSSEIANANEPRIPLDIEKIQNLYLDALNKDVFVENKKTKVNELSTSINNGIQLFELMGHLKSTYKDSLLTQCQAIAGFKIDNFDQLKKGENGNPLKIFERLGKIASENLVALTEAGETDGKYPTDDVMTIGITTGMGIDVKDINDKILCGKKDLYDDNSFIFKGLNKLTIDKELTFSNGLETFNKPMRLKPFSNLKYIVSNGINILNVHLPSDGPSKETIDVFLNKYLPTQLELNNIIPDLIVGDTNITCSKTNSLNVSNENRENIMKQMVDSIKKLYVDNNWALLMNTTNVNKIRSYGILLNQQPKKTNKEEASEPDGTAIFIKVDKSMTPEKIQELSKINFGQNWILLFNDTFYRYKHENVDFLKFDTNINGGCLDTNGFLIDRLFIDHTPVQISFNAIKQMTNKTELQQTWKNIVVLNAGSITNSTKNWILNILPCINDIQKIDETLYYGMKDVFVSENKDKDYASINGVEYAKWKINKENLNVVIPLLAKAHIDLSKLDRTCFPQQKVEPKVQVQGTSIGGKYTKKGKRKSKRR